MRCESIVYFVADREPCIVSKDKFLDRVSEYLHIDKAIYRNQPYEYIIKDITKKYPGALTLIAPKMYAFTSDRGFSLTVCLLGKTVEDFLKIYEKNRHSLNDSTWKAARRVDKNILKSTPLAEDKIKEIVHRFAYEYLRDNYSDKLLTGMAQEVKVKKYSCANVLQKQIKADYKVDIPVDTLKDYLKKEFEELVKDRDIYDVVSITKYRTYAPEDGYSGEIILTVERRYDGYYSSDTDGNDNGPFKTSSKAVSDWKAYQKDCGIRLTKIDY